MSNYTAQEVQAAVEKIVRSSVRHPTGILGDRKIDVSFSDIQEAAAGVYILYFNAPFYTLLLGVKRLADLLESQASTVESLIDAVEATDRLVTPVKDLSPLANARSALEELEAAVSSRTDGFQDITQVPAYRRYVQNLDGFIGTVGPNIKAADSTSQTGSRVVDTPGGARAKIPALVRQLTEQHSELIRRVKLLSGAIADFSSLNLPRIAAQGVISRARDVLDQHFTELSALDENARLDSLRSVVLDLLTQRPLVQKYGAAQAPSEFIATSGLAQAYADNEHPAVSASLFGGKPGPFPIVASNQFIRFTMDGGASFDYPLPLAFVAELNGNIVEPYQIDPDRDLLTIGFGNVDTGLPTYSVNLTNGLRTAAQIAAEVNAVITGTGLVCERRFYPLRYSAPVVITSLGGNNARFTILAGNLTSLGVVTGDEVDVKSGPNAGTTWEITAVDPLGQYVDAVGVAPVTPVALPGDTIEIGPAPRALRFIDTDEAGSLSQRRTTRLVSDGGLSSLTAAVLGFFAGAEARSRPISAQAVVDNINTSTLKLGAERTFVPRFYEGTARSEPADPTRVVLSKWIDGGTATGGTVVTIHTGGLIPEEVVVGDKLVIRSSPTTADIGLEGEITDLVAHDIVEVTFPGPLTAGLVDFEVGPDLSFGFGDVLVINDGPNTGRYLVGEDQGVRVSASFELALEGSLPVFKNGEAGLDFTVQFGSEYVTFKSRATTLATAVQVDNAGSSLGANYFLDPVDIGSLRRGFTSYIHFDEFPLGATVGDAVQEYVNQYNVVSASHTITTIDTTLSVLELASLVTSTFSLSFDFGIPNPFGRIRIAQVANYQSLKERLDVWLNQPEQQELYFRDLARFLNPVVTNANPTVAMVNDASNHLKKLLAVLTEDGAATYGSLHVPAVGTSQCLNFALSDYEAPAVEPVDALLSTFRQKGSDRAIDLLLEGQFSTFFNLNVDGVSYSGALMSGLRDLAREDLPIRKFDRRDTAGEKLIGSMPDEKDFEFSSDDADSPNVPDIPAAPDAASPGENF